jgi:hypothetical protein
MKCLLREVTKVEVTEDVMTNINENLHKDVKLPDSKKISYELAQDMTVAYL